MVHRSKHPNRLFLGSPSILATSDGRLIASLDQFGPGVADCCEGPIGERYGFDHQLQGLIYTSDDDGATWDLRAKFPFCHARLFEADGVIYLLGHKGNIMIMKSEDRGRSWSEPVSLTDPDDTGGRYTQAPANVLAVGGEIYLIMMYITDPGYDGYFVSTLAMVALEGRADLDLTVRDSWRISRPSPAFRDFVPEEALDYFGVPFFSVPDRNADALLANGGRANRIGWHEAHLVRIEDPDHLWYDETGTTFHVIARADAHRSNLAAMAVLQDRRDDDMRFMLQRTPSGNRFVFLPLPGGNIKFHILYDEPSKRYWLLSSQITDSMTRPEALPDDGRYGLPADQRERLVLHVSKNLIDWQFVALVALGKTSRESRHYASMCVDGDDLCVLSRSGDKDAKNAHDANMITFHRVKDFRDLLY